MRQDTFAILPNVPVGFVIVLFLTVFAVWGGLIAWRWAATHREASTIYAAKREFGEIAPHVSEDDFRAAYVSAEAPRGALYFFAAALGCSLVTPPVMGVFAHILDTAWPVADQMAATTLGAIIYSMAYTLFLFLACLAIMLAILVVTLRLYHAHTPPNLSRAIRELNGAAPSDQPRTDP